jgi:phosphoribosylformimino-5-aminoimidazole carboxamide ribotide isomerase
VSFLVLPAIDLRGGRVVRLVEGDFARETDYGGDAVAVAGGFAAAGARMLHVVDLDGAREGRPLQLATVEAVAAAAEVGIEVAGGLRTVEDVAAAFAAGADRVVVGTRALEEPVFARALVDTYAAEAIVAALDVRGGMAVGQGWREGAPGVAVEEALNRLADAGVETFEVTAVERDGRLEGPDLALLGRLVALDRGAIIASGGIRSLDDLRASRDAGCAGAIVGRALYEGHLDLAEAVAAFG